MMRTSLFVASALLGLTLTACGGDTGAEPDSGTPDGGIAAGDAGPPDSGSVEPMDSGIDSGTVAEDAGGTPRDGSLLPPSDAGDPFGDAGALGTPPWVPIDVITDGTTCDPLVPCGGDVVGTWDVQGGCVEVDLSMLDACPGAEVRSVSGRARGRVSFDGTIARRIAQSEIEMEVFVPTLCASFLGGCSGLEDQLRMQVAEATCVMETAGCACAARDGVSIDDGDGYTLEGNEIVSSTGKRWAYCIDGTDLRYEDVTPDTVPGTREIGIIDLTKR